MEPVLEPGAPVVKGTLVLVEGPVAQVGNCFVEGVPLVQVKLVRVAVDLGAYQLTSLLAVGVDVPFTDGAKKNRNNWLFTLFFSGLNYD